MNENKTHYGKELILDLERCTKLPQSRESLNRFMIDLCERINMKRHELYFWDYDDRPEEYEKAPVHLKGTSAIQFISTSNITIHTLDDMKTVYLNIFSCKSFEPEAVVSFCMGWFGGVVKQTKEVSRG